MKMIFFSTMHHMFSSLTTAINAMIDWFSDEIHKVQYTSELHHTTLLVK